MLKFIRRILIITGVIVAFGSCNTVNDDRIPSYPVNLDLSNWSTYGVSAIGDYKVFIAALREPRNFYFSTNTRTGFGGVLLVSGQNPFTLEVEPMAYDLACPVECSPDVRVKMQPDGPLPVAVCEKCGSHFNVVMRGGTPESGPAHSRKLGLRRYECRKTVSGGYLIVNN